jgi:hypothetical protein
MNSAMSQLYLDGNEKFIRSLAKLINHGHAVWTTGNIMSSDGGAFVNLGDIQMGRGAQFFKSDDFIEGHIIPLEDGGDVFALDFHSWDDNIGGLSYEEYVNLRAQFVSRAPRGWSESDQL